MKDTTNYNLPLYDATDNPDLILGYNAAITTIDSQMQSNADAAAGAIFDAAEAKTVANKADATATTALNKATSVETTVNGYAYVPLTVEQLAKGLTIVYKK